MPPSLGAAVFGTRPNGNPGLQGVGAARLEVPLAAALVLAVLLITCILGCSILSACALLEVLPVLRPLHHLCGRFASGQWIGPQRY